MRTIRTVAVEGNIASGKTACLEFFKQSSAGGHIEVFAEPVNKWRNVRGHNTLDLMYKDQSRWSLTFQTYVQLTMLDSHVKTITKQMKMMERSIFSAKYCFVENLHTRNMMPDVEHAVLSEWFDWITSNMKSNVSLDLILYLRTKPETVYERLLIRDRQEEIKVSLDYLKSLHDLHEDWLLRQKWDVPCKVVTVEADNDLVTMYSKYEDLIPELSQLLLPPPVLDSDETSSTPLNF